MIKLRIYNCKPQVSVIQNDLVVLATMSDTSIANEDTAEMMKIYRIYSPISTSRL